MKNFGFSLLFLLSFVIFETAILSNLLFLPAVPDFILIVTLYLSVNNGRLFGCGTGFAGGLLLDFLSGCPFGLNTLLRTITGYIFGFFHKNINVSGFIFPFIFGVIATLLKAFILWVISILYINVNITYNLISTPFLFEILANGFLTPLVFKFLDIFRNTLVLGIDKVN